MYATYVYGAGATAANILADVIAILTGTTDVNSLSASCTKASSSIDVSSCVAGWEVYDASAGTNARCLRAAVADNGTQYKYMVVDTNTAGVIHTKIYEGWNSSTHVGTNLASTSDSASQRLLVASGGRLDISASARHAIFFSFQGGAYGAAPYFNPSGVFERTRLSPWDTVANQYPPFLFWCAPSLSSYEPRSLSAAGGDIYTTNAKVYMRHAFGGGVVNPVAMPASSVPCDSSKTALKHAFSPLSFGYATNGHLGGDITSLCDVWVTTDGYGSSFDTVTYNGNTYVIWAVSTGWRFAVRKG